MSDFIEVNEQNFEEMVLKSSRPVLLEFGATWCQPCKRLEPILKQLSEVWKERAQIARLDVDQSVQLTMKYQVMSVPTVILFANGEPRQRVTGLQPRDRMVEKFEPFL